MTINDITTAISAVGFPIVMCAALFWYLVKTNQAHKDEVDRLSEALNNNTIAITKLTDFISKKGEYVE